MIDFKRKAIRKTTRATAFSLVEVLVVVAIIGLLASMGTYSYVSQINESRLESAAIRIESNLKQARQMAIAMRESRRVVIDYEPIDNEDNDNDGVIDEPIEVWIEGKVSENLPFDGMASRNRDPRQKTVNAYPITDPVRLPDKIAIADVDTYVPDGNDIPGVFYIEFNARGQASKVYFQGEESTYAAKNLRGVIHLTRANETFTIQDGMKTYADMLNDAKTNTLTWDQADASERFKVHTLEVVRLTGRTRRYGFGIFAPWATDEFEN